MLLVEPPDALFVSAVHNVWMPFKSWPLKQFAPCADLVHEFLVLHVSMR